MRNCGGILPNKELKLIEHNGMAAAKRYLTVLVLSTIKRKETP
jgi:hypothetical protein